MEYHNSFHSISEFIRQGKGRLLLDRQRLQNARRNVEKGKKSRMIQLAELAEQHQVPIEERPPQELQCLLEQSHYRGYILKIEASQGLQPVLANAADVLRRKPKLVVLLDGILDVGNLGAILRSADLFSVGAVFVSHRSAGRSERNAQNHLGRAASGANAWIPLIEGNLAQIAQQLQEGGYWLYGADMSGQAAAQTEFQQPCALLLGAEERGISNNLRSLSDVLVRIPTNGHINSLNVSAAAAVLMYEIQRQWTSHKINDK